MFFFWQWYSVVLHYRLFLINICRISFKRTIYHVYLNLAISRIISYNLAVSWLLRLFEFTADATKEVFHLNVHRINVPYVNAMQCVSACEMKGIVSRYNAIFSRCKYFNRSTGTILSNETFITFCEWIMPSSSTYFRCRTKILTEETWHNRNKTSITEWARD